MSSVCVVQTKEKYKVTSALLEKHEELLRQSSNLMHLREVMLILLQRIIEHKIEVGNLHPIKKPLRRVPFHVAEEIDFLCLVLFSLQIKKKIFLSVFFFLIM